MNWENTYIMVRKLMGFVLVLVSLAACATVPKSNPGTEARVQEANSSLDALSKGARPVEPAVAHTPRSRIPPGVPLCAPALLRAAAGR